MDKVITIYEAKTHLSKYIKQAKAGTPVYIGSYGQQEVMLVPIPKKNPIKIGIWKDRARGYTDKDIVGPDPDINRDFEESLNQPLP
jgi:antitoxin (DNA-binding transcriptional repressor) of toxin-antitoxin stability system